MSKCEKMKHISFLCITLPVVIKLCSLQLTLGSFLGLLGLRLEENRKQLVCSPHTPTSSDITLPHVFPLHATQPPTGQKRVVFWPRVAYVCEHGEQQCRSATCQTSCGCSLWHRGLFISMRRTVTQQVKSQLTEVLRPL